MLGPEEERDGAGRERPNEAPAVISLDHASDRTSAAGSLNPASTRWPSRARDRGDERQLAPVAAEGGQLVEEPAELGRTSLVAAQTGQVADPSPVGSAVQLLKKRIDRRHRHGVIVAPRGLGFHQVSAIAPRFVRRAPFLFRLRRQLWKPQAMRPLVSVVRPPSGPGPDVVDLAVVGRSSQ